MTDVLVSISAVMITIAAASMIEPILGGIAASNPIPIHLAMERQNATAEPSTPKLAHARPRCRLRAAPLQWNVDWFFRLPTAPGYRSLYRDDAAHRCQNKIMGVSDFTHVW